MKKIILAVLMLSSVSTFAQSKNSSLELGAMLDFYYLYTPEGTLQSAPIENRNYDNKTNDFTMNLVELNASGSVNKVDFYVDLDFGQFAEQNSTHDDDPQNFNIGQAYLTYNFSDRLAVSAGKMYTHVGYEVAKAMDNYNYSRSFAFSLGGPFWHEGVALNYSAKNGMSYGLYVYDNSDSTAENNEHKTYGAQVGYSNDSFSILVNGLSGIADSGSGLRSIYEFNTEYALNDNLSVALNGVFGKDEEAAGNNVDSEWNAFVAYVNWKATKKWSFTPRYEIFSDKTEDGALPTGYFFGSKANDMTSVTLTSTFHAEENSEFRFEVRQDSTDEKIWQNAEGDFEDSLTTLSVSWLVRI